MTPNVPLDAQDKEVDNVAPQRTQRLRRLPLLIIAVLVTIVGVVILIRRDEGSNEPLPATGSPAYPLQVSSDRRYLIDQDNSAQFVAADTAWNLFSRLSDAEVARYLEARKQQGFNTVLVSVVDLSAGGITGKNQFGETPFVDGFDSPNPAFFDHVDAVLEAAADRGMQLVIVPAWLSLASKESSYTVENASAYGEWLGERYQRFDNVIWMVGGDWGSFSGSEGMCPNQAETRALAQGINSSDPRHLITQHPGVGLASSMCYNDDSWLGINADYWDFNDQNVSSAYRFLHRDYANGPTRPTIMIETGYEGPFPTDRFPDALTAKTSRMQSYFMILAGAMGFTYGVNQTYAMVNGDPNAARTWQETLTIPGGFQQGYIAQLFTSLEWWKLVPDQDHSTVTSGWGSFGQEDYVTAGRAADGSLVVAYLPSSGAITADLTKLNGPVTARWFDPTDNTFMEAGSGLANSDSQQFDPPARNNAGDEDFVLLLQTEPPR